MKRIAYIWKYLQDEMSASERKEFISWLEIDAANEEDLSWVKRIWKESLKIKDIRIQDAEKTFKSIVSSFPGNGLLFPKK